MNPESKTKKSPRRSDKQPAEKPAQTVAGSMAGGRDSAAAKTGLWFRRIGGAVLTLFILAGAAAGIIAVNQPATAGKGIDTTARKAAQVHQEQAGGYAVEFVGTWLTATQETAGQLMTYLGDSGSDLSVENENPVRYKDLAAVSTEKIGTDRVLVTVSAAIADPQPTEPADKTTDTGKMAEPTPEPAPEAEEVAVTWTGQHYQVVVIRTGGQMVVAGLPTPVAAPAAGSSTADEYTHDVLDDSLRTEVEEMLAAYAAGQGDLARYTTAGLQLTPIAPTPYESVSVVSLKATEPVDGSAAGGGRLHVAATVELTGSGIVNPATYYLTLVSESETWQMADLSAAPVAGNK